MKLPNILFIPVDDLRPQLGCYGHPQMVTPHIDRLAEQGVRFANAYCQVPVCGATRASLLTGVRPSRDRFVSYATRVDDDLPGALTLPQHFRANGYETVSVGKVFHHLDDTDERSWSTPPWRPGAPGTWRNYLTEENRRIEAANQSRGAPYEQTDVPDDAYFDGQIAARAIEELHRLKQTGRPFFLAAGFLKPHLPFNAPTRYWNYYRPADVPLADNPYRPNGAPDQSMHNWGELRHYFDVPREGPLPEEMAQRLVHGYYAATSYMDAQVGRLLNELDRLGLADNTIVVLWGDHGWQLGEHGLWCKHCNFQTSLNAPLIIRTPDGARDQAAPGIVEFLGVYPTLCELAGIEVPPHVQGASLAPLLADPRETGANVAFSRYYAGESVRCGDHLYTEWIDDAGAITARMLYDHRTDAAENVNVVEQPENADIVARLSAMAAEMRATSAAPERR